ncbi:MAG: arginyltransferase [Methylohalobius sp.]|nr:arginyltransferase [Methylohalobius sp.]
MGELPFSLSAPFPCPYLPRKTSRLLFSSLDLSTYSHLVAQGFRRSGDLAYRPYCPSCQACIPVRIEVTQFRPNRSQRRCWKYNQELTVSVKDPNFSSEHFAVYQLYLKARHGDTSQMMTAQDLNFLISRWVRTQLYEFRLQRRLVCVAVSDILEDGLSAVYTFFDPEFAKRSLGTYAVLWQIGEARKMGLRFLYLGYFIKDCRKMAYKIRFKPQQWYFNSWQPVNLARRFYA